MGILFIVCCPPPMSVLCKFNSWLDAALERVIKSLQPFNETL